MSNIEEHGGLYAKVRKLATAETSGVEIFGKCGMLESKWLKLFISKCNI